MEKKRGNPAAYFDHLKVSRGGLKGVQVHALWPMCPARKIALFCKAGLLERAIERPAWQGNVFRSRPSSPENAQDVTPFPPHKQPISPDSSQPSTVPPHVRRTVTPAPGARRCRLRRGPGARHECRWLHPQEVFYTVPSPLIGHPLAARLYDDDRLELFLDDSYQLTSRAGDRSSAISSITATSSIIPEEETDGADESHLPRRPVPAPGLPALLREGPRRP